MNTFSDWVESRNKGWSNPSGFLAVTSINWLSETPQTFKDVTGSWKAIGGEGAGEVVALGSRGEPHPSDFNEPDRLGVAWNDPVIGADWGVAEPIMSERDRTNPMRADIPEGRRPYWPMRT